jgi:hypothetical protein
VVDINPKSDSSLHIYRLYSMVAVKTICHMLVTRQGVWICNWIWELITYNYICYMVLNTRQFTVLQHIWSLSCLHQLLPGNGSKHCRFLSFLPHVPTNWRLFRESTWPKLTTFQCSKLQQPQPTLFRRLTTSGYTTVFLFISDLLVFWNEPLWPLESVWLLLVTLSNGEWLC